MASARRQPPSPAQFTQALEQQWQRNAAGTVPSRPFLDLGLSKNVSYTYDATRLEGDRITSIVVNGAPIDRAKSTGSVRSPPRARRRQLPGIRGRNRHARLGSHRPGRLDRLHHRSQPAVAELRPPRGVRQRMSP
ncbi:5'-nucleotidase C-terminal domain-containing protein [Leifsonia sp. McL0607]|uniref:5'-nucleotidase C-terminal domain-containing protein n=1 Tax=Leifsonia sp. McL0607 TaxID=3415672 RepID=UPI003CEC0003